MKAAVIPAVNEPWELRDFPIPRPGPGQVLIRVHASGICYNDVLASRGSLPFPSMRPAVTGHEPVGEVVEVGAGVLSRKVGDRVGVTWVREGCGRCDYCRLGLPVTGQTAMNCPAASTTGFTAPGGHAEFMTAGADATVLLPDGLAYELAAPVMCAGYTAWSALRAGRPEPGDRVAVLGLGALGHLAVQYAHACGFETVVMTRSADKHDAAKTLNADFVVSSGEQLRGIGGADVVLATAPSHPAAAEALGGLRVNGRLVLAGIDVEAPFSIPSAMQYPFFAQGQSIVGATHGGPALLREALDLVANGKVTPMVETFPAARVAEGVDKVARGAVRFRAVVTYA
ncbi:alcohol dehydrogenase catalytic domain-containing protein [Winogradskya consettensis]|uniref:alcohol dehydrogenase n=1 Tax=Winogradskya consettensis TaxID=113560 RepID=A0A919T4B0_9ACTN|nr:alcohol dehydrogenase catalytic domain-containing protein [Actinoplanes consettensis]GIM85408.1 alcohol dehydrogenase [Actinoplanes consettensis]